MKRRIGVIATEEQEQIALVEWLTLKGILFYHIPNGQNTNKITGKRFQRLGLQSGVPDLCVPIKSKAYGSLYIELKRKRNGVVTGNQEKWIGELNSNGQLAMICYGFDEAKNAILDYLELKD